MAFKEQKAWDTIRAASVGVLTLQRIESSVGDGIPDVIGINRKGSVFWMELKALEAWPKRETTVPLKGKFEKGQLGFLRQWASWKGSSFVLLRVGVEYFLLDARLSLDIVSVVELLEKTVIMKGKKEIVQYLEALA